MAEAVGTWSGIGRVPVDDRRQRPARSVALLPESAGRGEDGEEPSCARARILSGRDCSTVDSFLEIDYPSPRRSETQPAKIIDLFESRSHRISL